jgi:uncharacterized Zn-binding protein involved in type VI secretion
MSQAARVGDRCAETSVIAPPRILPPGVADVMIGDRPAAVAGQQIVAGSASVFVGDQPLARAGDRTATRGTVAEGCASVDVG